MLCPKDFKPCCDDLCYGGGCLITGEAMYERCGGCGALVSDDDHENCTCDDYEDERSNVELRGAEPACRRSVPLERRVGPLDEADE